MICEIWECEKCGLRVVLIPAKPIDSFNDMPPKKAVRKQAFLHYPPSQFGYKPKGWVMKASYCEGKIVNTGKTITWQEHLDEQQIIANHCHRLEALEDEEVKKHGKRPKQRRNRRATELV